MHHILPSCLCWLRVRPHVESVVLGFAVALVMFLSSGNGQAFAQSGVWVAKTPMPIARSAVMVAGIAGKLYVVGGAIPDIDVATLEVYDPATDTWTEKTPMPTARRWPAVEAIDGLLYVAGGEQEGPGPGSLAILEVYDPATDTWTTKSSLPVPRDSMASGVIDGKLYLAGGLSTNDESVATLLVYDPNTDSWTEKTPMPTARAFPAGAVLNSQLYVITGIAEFDSPPLRTVNVYDPASDTWRAAVSIPTGRDRLGEVGVVAGKLYVAGGWNPCFSCDIATLEVFEPTEDSDSDGIPDNEDECPDSDLSATVIVDGCDSEVTNTVFPSGCTLADLLADCAEKVHKHRKFVHCIDRLTNTMKRIGIITHQQKDAIQSCAVQADLP